MQLQNFVFPHLNALICAAITNGIMRQVEASTDWEKRAILNWRGSKHLSAAGDSDVDCKHVYQTNSLLSLAFFSVMFDVIVSYKHNANTLFGSILKSSWDVCRMISSSDKHFRCDAFGEYIITKQMQRQVLWFSHRCVSSLFAVSFHRRHRCFR